jgi:hypothetical protein
MKKKILFSLITIVLLLGVTIGCNNSEKSKNKNEKEEIKDVNIAKEYTELELLGRVAKFKLQNPTNYWNCEDDFGAGEIDAVYIPSKNGVEVPNYYEKENISGVIFQTSDDVLTSESNLKSTYQRWYGIDIEVNSIEKGIYKRHIKGESSSIYYEAYCFDYEGDFEGEKSDVYYKIELIIYKNDYTKDEINKLISEYNTIIDSFKLK